MNYKTICCSLCKHVCNIVCFVLLQTSMSVVDTGVTDALTLMVPTGVNAMRDITTLQLLQPVLVRGQVKCN